MTFLDLKGRKKSIKKPNKYLIDWEGKSLSKFQKVVKDFLFYYWKTDYVFEEFPVLGTRSKFDIYNASKRIVVEINGRHHTEFVPHFQKTRANFLGQIKRDLEKHSFCEKNGITLVELTEKEFYGKTREQVEQLFASQGVNL